MRRLHLALLFMLGLTLMIFPSCGSSGSGGSISEVLDFEPVQISGDFPQRFSTPSVTVADWDQDGELEIVFVPMEDIEDGFFIGEFSGSGIRFEEVEWDELPFEARRYGSLGGNPYDRSSFSLAGGIDENGDLLGDFWSWSVDTGVFNELGNLTTPRAGLSVVMGRYDFYGPIGGFDDNGFVTDFFEVSDNPNLPEPSFVTRSVQTISPLGFHTAVFQRDIVGGVMDGIMGHNGVALHDFTVKDNNENLVTGEGFSVYGYNFSDESAIAFLYLFLLMGDGLYIAENPGDVVIQAGSEFVLVNEFNQVPSVDFEGVVYSGGAMVGVGGFLYLFMENDGGENKVFRFRLPSED